VNRRCTNGHALEAHARFCQTCGARAVDVGKGITIALVRYVAELIGAVLGTALVLGFGTYTYIAHDTIRHFGSKATAMVGLGVVGVVLAVGTAVVRARTSTMQSRSGSLTDSVPMIVLIVGTVVAVGGWFGLNKVGNSPDPRPAFLVGLVGVATVIGSGVLALRAESQSTTGEGRP
jgi:drug/metabolite transporter (DMT)-like permease